MQVLTLVSEFVFAFSSGFYIVFDGIIFYPNRESNAPMKLISLHDVVYTLLLFLRSIFAHCYLIL